MSDTRLEEVDRRIADLRKRLSAAESIRQAIADDPGLLDLLAMSSNESVSSNGKPSAKKSGQVASPARTFRGGPKAKEHFKKVADYLISKSNQPHTIPQIAKAVGLKPSNVIQLCYRTHAAFLEPSAVPEHKTRKQWKLKANWRDGLPIADK